MADLGFIVPPPTQAFPDPNAGLTVSPDPYAVTGGVDPTTGGVADPFAAVASPPLLSQPVAVPPIVPDLVASIAPSPLAGIADAYVLLIVS